jgi:hypothetical protein
VWPVYLSWGIVRVFLFGILDSTMVKTLQLFKTFRVVCYCVEFVLKFAAQFVRLCFDVYVLCKSFELLLPKFSIDLQLAQLFNALNQMFMVLCDWIAVLTFQIPLINIPLKFLFVEVFRQLEYLAQVMAQFLGRLNRAHTPRNPGY